MRYLALDLGDKRTGLALGDDETGIVSPVGVVELDRRALGEAKYADALAALVREHLGPDPQPAPSSRRASAEIIVGLPLNMDGTQGPPALAAQAIVVRLASLTSRRVHAMDERLSSAQAEWSLSGRGLTRGGKKQRRDALAAAAILKEYLESRNGEHLGPGQRAD